MAFSIIRRATTLGLTALAVAGLVFVPSVAQAAEAVEARSAVIRPVRQCAGLPKDFQIPGAPTHITATAVVPATATDPEHCDVQGFVEPAVKFRLKLPTSSYTGRYLQSGCGGLCGAIPDLLFPDNCLPRNGEFAIAATDDGHEGKGTFPFLDGAWAANNQAARDDWSFRAPHVVSLASKRIIATYYGAPPRHSYFSGCSNGGREALLLAQRYPDDFDGIIAGAPGAYISALMVYQAWLARANTAPDGSSILTPDKLATLHNAVIAACDNLDGLLDGQLDDPRRCKYDPILLRCPANTDQPDCLTPAQVETTRKLYAGPTDEAGRLLYPGYQPYGSELAWNGWVTPIPGTGSIAGLLADNTLKYLAYPIGTPHSSLADFRFTSAEFHKLTAEGYKANSLNLDLSAFRRAGGKLVIWHGWADMAIPPHGTLDYYDRLVQRSGGLARTQQWARLFMVPSLYHCAEGGKLGEFDPLRETVAWVEWGQAPQKVIATGRDEQGNVLRTRPVFPYPLQAKYDGSGSIDDAADFVAVPPQSPPKDQISWVGTYQYAIPGPRA
ncbi:feruloyl esterase [Kibdelosporangium banguiense]|uniref:Feruloyl esterase n=1 Tax=Kibdelosporangium banguiense TaxID=1365924 RepID=A0ABS4TPB4_9PSEU|nr:tannase/feruloyl esterase family alpha/beta hydrolase [Kibdelosporangium banguiense]MBP2325793.1 feruloyl esterase [Kibdelosporangium banguiense]